MKRIAVFFADFWQDFDPVHNNFVALLARRFDVVHAANESAADVIFESHFRRRVGRRVDDRASDDARGRSPVRIFVSGERFNLPVGRHHAVISNNLLATPNHFRYPVWMLSFPLAPSEQSAEMRRFGCAITYEMVQRPMTREHRPKFACAVFHNPSHFRYEAVRQLSAHGPVDLYGHPAGRPVLGKCRILSEYRLNLCPENAVLPGYVSEKIVEARAAGCIPLWWGDPSYRVDFHERAVVNLYELDFDVTRALTEVDFRELAQTPLLRQHPDDINASCEAFLHRIVSNPPDERFLESVAGTASVCMAGDARPDREGHASCP